MSSSGTHTTLDREAVGRVDASDLVTDILALPEHLRDALWKVESAGLDAVGQPRRPRRRRDGRLGDRRRAGRARSSPTTPRARSWPPSAYGLPPWTTPDTTVLCASYSGDTEETLACYEAAGVIGARRVVVTSGGELAEQARADGVPVIPVAGGLQPRAAVGYMTVAALEVAALCGVGPALQLRDRRGRRAPRGARRGVGPGRARGGRGQGRWPAPCTARSRCIVGAGLTTPLAYRWKTQINENAKQPAFADELPEADHNEIVGWERAPTSGASPPSSSTTPTRTRGSRRASS